MEEFDAKAFVERTYRLDVLKKAILEHVKDEPGEVYLISSISPWTRCGSALEDATKFFEMDYDPNGDAIAMWDDMKTRASAVESYLNDVLRDALDKVCGQLVFDMYGCWTDFGLHLILWS